MKILALSDTHFGYSTGRTAYAKEVSHNRMFEVFEDVLTLAKKDHYDAVIHAGDMFNRSSPKKKDIAKAYSIIESFLDSGIPFIAIPGNHDRSVLPETLMTYYKKNLHFSNKVSTLSLDFLNIVCVPHFKKHHQAYFKYISRMIQNKSQVPTIVVCHQLFSGASFGPHSFVFRDSDDCLSSRVLPSNVLFVVTGHIHKAQTVQQKKVVYTGSLERTSFAEAIEKKGYLSIEVEDDYFSVEFKEIPSFPMDVVEEDIGEDQNILENIDESIIDGKIRTLLRLYGRNLDVEEISSLFRYFPPDDYPFLQIAPKIGDVKLKKLFGKYQVQSSFESFYASLD